MEQNITDSVRTQDNLYPFIIRPLMSTNAHAPIYFGFALGDNCSTVFKTANVVSDLSVNSQSRENSWINKLLLVHSPKFSRVLSLLMIFNFC